MKEYTPMSSTPTTSSGGRAGAPGEFFDVVVIGAGIVGSAIARKLSGYRLSVDLLEARDDVGEATSKATTAILHTSFDAKTASLNSRMMRQRCWLLVDGAKVTGYPVHRTG